MNLHLLVCTTLFFNQAFANPANQGTRNFKDLQGVKIFPMMQSVAMAAYAYPDDFANKWGTVLATCNGMQMAAVGVGYTIAFVYAEGIVNALGVTKILEAAIKQGGGCKAVNVVLDGGCTCIRHQTTEMSHHLLLVQDIASLSISS
jgi:hypothetical protein